MDQVRERAWVPDFKLVLRARVSFGQGVDTMIEHGDLYTRNAVGK